MNDHDDTTPDDAPALPQCAAARCRNTLREYEPGPLCGQCVRTIRAWMIELPYQMNALRASRLRERAGDGGRAGTRTPPLPGRPDTLNMLGPGRDNIHDPNGDQHGPLPVAVTLGGWVRVVAEERGLRGPQRWTVEGMAGWLENHVDWAADRPWAPDMRDELGDMMAAIRGVTRLFPQRRAVPRPCPRCANLTLIEKDHDDKVECTTCGNRYMNSELCDDAPATLARLQREEREREAAAEGSAA